MKAFVGLRGDKDRLEQDKVIYKAGIREGIRRSYEDMKVHHYIIDYDLDTLVAYLEKKYGKPD